MTWWCIQGRIAQARLVAGVYYENPSEENHASYLTTFPHCCHALHIHIARYQDGMPNIRQLSTSYSLSNLHLLVQPACRGLSPECWAVHVALRLSIREICARFCPRHLPNYIVTTSPHICIQKANMCRFGRVFRTRQTIQLVFSSSQTIFCGVLVSTPVSPALVADRQTGPSAPIPTRKERSL